MKLPSRKATKALIHPAPTWETEFLSANAVGSNQAYGGTPFLYPENTGEGLFPPTSLVSSIPLTNSARSYLEILKMAEMLADTTVGRISMEINRAEADGHPVVCVLLSPMAEKRLLSETITLGWNQPAVTGDIKTFMGYEALVEPKLAAGDYLVVTV